MNTLFALRALLFAGECFAASAILLSLAWLATHGLRQASLRHLVWVTAFGTLLVLPVAALIVPPQIVLRPPAQQPARSVARAVPAYVQTFGDVSTRVSVSETIPSEPAIAAAPSVKVAPYPPAAIPAGFRAPALPKIGAAQIAVMLFAVWVAGFCWTLFRFLAGMAGIARLRRNSRPHSLSPADLPPLAWRGRECELRLSLSQEGPLTFGFFRPVILLPKEALAWPRARLHAVLLHELSHVRRRDSVSQALSFAVSALYWPNPLAWIGARALRREAEIAADDAVIAAGVRPSDYAGELLRFASEFRCRRTAVAEVAMASRSSLETRVRSVLAPDQLRTGVTAMDIFKTACLGLAATALLALARPDIVRADSPTPLEPPAAPAPDAVPAPPAPPPAPAAMPAPPAVPEAPPPPDASADEGGAAGAGKHHAHIRILKLENGKVVRVDDAKAMDEAMRELRKSKVEIHRAMDEAMRQMHAHEGDIRVAVDNAKVAEIEIRKAEPEIERALRAAKIDEQVADAIANAHVDAKVAEALRKAEPAIRAAIAKAHISEKVAQALREAQPKIDAAIVRIRKSAGKNGHVVIEREESPAQGMDQDSDSDDNADDDDEAPSPSGHE